MCQRRARCFVNVPDMPVGVTAGDGIVYEHLRLANSLPTKPTTRLLRLAGHGKLPTVIRHA